ncbi:MAG: HEAT repeat domain-containing protein, partial [Planctomycetota bacterium]
MRAYLLMTAAVLVWTSAVQAQTPKPVNRGRKPKFAEPDPGERAGQDTERTAPKDPLVETLGRLSGWPGESARRAAEQLIVQKERSRDLVLRTLASSDPKASKLKPGCAYVLGYIGEKSHALALILAASEPKQALQADDFFLAAYKLDPKLAIEESFRFFYDSRTTLRRQALKFVRNRVTRDHRDEILSLLDRRKAERGFTRVIGLTLWDRLIESEHLTWEEGGPRVYRALGDDSPQVARHAMKLLASRNDETNIKALNALIHREDGHWRERSYAALSIALMGRAFQTDPLEPASLEVLRGKRGLRHSRKLPQAAAALALAQAGLRSGDNELARLLDRDIPIILINSVGADGRHYRDFSTVRPLAYAMLRRITGQTLPDHAPRWARWWADYGKRFRARRELVEVSDDDYAETSIDLLSPREQAVGPIRISTVGSEPPTYLRGQAYAIPREEMVALVTFLREREFFTTTEADVSTLPSSAAVLVVHVGDLDRTCAYAHVDGSAVARDELIDELRRVAKRYDWQRWWDIGKQSSWALFYSENLRWFRDNTDPEARARRLRTMVAGSLTDLRSIDLKMDAVRLVAGLPGGGESLTKNQVDAFVRAVQREPEANVFVQEVVHLLVPEAGKEVIRKLVDVLAVKVGPAEDAVLASLAEGIDTATLIKLAADDRWKVRLAVVASLGQRDEPAAKLVLLQRLQDKDEKVRMTAVEQLARKKDPAVLPKLRALARDSMQQVRGSVAYAYGYLAGN